MTVRIERQKAGSKQCIEESRWRGQLSPKRREQHSAEAEWEDLGYRLCPGLQPVLKDALRMPLSVGL